MGEHLEFGKHLHKADYDDRFRQTYLGQGHLAGTGPEGATCRLCAHWGLLSKEDKVKSPGHFSKNDEDAPGALKKGRCNAPIPHKARRRFPHYALACSLFVENENPPVELKVFAEGQEDEVEEEASEDEE